MILKNCQYWIFDMDGTLTVPVHNFDEIRMELGLPEGQYILESLSKMPDTEAAPLRARLEEIEFDIADRAVEQPGAKELLTKLKESGKQIGILTRNGEAIAQRTLKACGLDPYFDETIVIGRETCLPKPEPDGVNHLLTIWNVSCESIADQAVIVGDFLFDIEAGYRAGIKTVYLDNHQLGNVPDIATLSVTNLNELAELV